MLCPAKPRQRCGRDVVKIEGVRNVHTNISRELMADLKYPNVEHHLRPRIAELLHELCASPDRWTQVHGLLRYWRSVRTDKAQLEHVPHGRDQFGSFLRCGMRRQQEGLQQHAVIALVVFGSVGRDEYWVVSSAAHMVLLTLQASFSAVKKSTSSTLNTTDREGTESSNCTLSE